MSVVNIFLEYWPQLLQGLWMTIQLSLLVTLVGLALGLVAALGRASGVWIFRTIASLYVETIRGVPPLLLLFAIYFTLPEHGITLSSFVSAVIALGLYAGSFTCEIFRAGIGAVPRGQLEAGRSLGLTKWQLNVKVVFPQAFRMMIPPLANQIIMNIKGTSLAVTITVPELMFVAYTGASNTFRAGDFYLIAAIFYLALIIPLGQISKRLEGSRFTRSSKLLSTTTTSNKVRRMKVH